MSRYQALAEQTQQLIDDGILRAGDRLPSIRQACRTHDISPVTVMQAYYLLENRGLIEARPRSGYFVRARLGHKLSEPGMTQPESGSTRLQVSDFIFQILESVRDPLIVPLGSGFPCPRLYPLDKLGRFLAGSARKFAPQDTLTGLPPGHEELRRQLALRYLAQGAAVSPQEIVITSGAMEGLNLCLQAVTQPGDLIAVESPTFYAGLQASERLGLKVIEIPSHPREGVSLAALDDALRHYPVKACLFMLNFANPTGSCVPDARRRALVELLDQMAYAMGGRTAEEVVFHDPTTGASNDIEKATNIARQMVLDYGFSDKLGAIKWSDDEQSDLGSLNHKYSARTAEIIDEEVLKLVETAHTEAWNVINENRDILDELVRQLLVKETLNEKELAAIFANIKKAPKREVWLSDEKRPDSDIPPVPIPDKLKQSAGLTN